jgi:hypothetical protein
MIRVNSKFKKMKQRKVYKKNKKNSLKTKYNNKKKIVHKKNNATKKQAMCAPFIQPIDISNLSKSKKMTKTNINIVKSVSNQSCFTIDALRKIATKWNETHPMMKIDFNNVTTGKTLWSSINNVMKYKCNTEVCWMKQDFIKNSYLAKELLKNFKPFMPKSWGENPREWLNTIDIRDVMNQYEMKYPAFEFIGPVPMDFDTKLGFGECVVDELCKISLEDLKKKGKTKIGVIFNLDKHTQSGSHWVAMHCDIGIHDGNGKDNGQDNGKDSSIKKGEICYWDSYGIKPNPEVVVLMNKLKEQSRKLGHDIEIKINKNRHQYKNSECGMYCIYFITSLLDGKTFENIVQTIVDDDTMNGKRNDFFNKIE